VPEPLPPVRGRAPRVALLVYNDAHADARVIKTATTLRAAGADVRIFAVARARSGYPEGEDTVGPGIPVQRAPEFELVRYAPWLVDLARRVLGRTAPAEAAADPAGVAAPRDDAAAATVPEVPAAAAPEVPAAVAASVPPTLQQQALALGNDLWLRGFRTVSLGLYWLKAAHAAVAWTPDVVHANDGNTLAPAWWVARRTGASVVYDAHELWRHRNVRQDRPLARHVEAVVESLGVGRAAGVITVSPSIAHWLQTAYDLPVLPTLVRNIPRRADDPAEPSDGRLRELAGLSADTQVIAYGGRITTSRGIEETLEALAMLPPQVHFVLLGYGEPDYLATLHARIALLGLGRRVHLVGKVPPAEVSTALADADLSVVYVRPICLSYEFSLPNKLFESIHAGLPVAAADLPDTAAVVREHGVGEIFDADSPTDMARTISTVLADPQRYRDASRAAAEVLTWQHEEAELLGLYRKVLRR
jgi:glycosyltransferase involved in cell wall biosynthesis